MIMTKFYCDFNQGIALLYILVVDSVTTLYVTLMTYLVNRKTNVSDVVVI